MSEEEKIEYDKLLRLIEERKQALLKLADKLRTYHLQTPYIQLNKEPIQNKE